MEAGRVTSAVPDCPSRRGCQETHKWCPGDPGATQHHLSHAITFTAKLAQADSYPCHTGVLKFANVSINEGDAYNPETGIFTCPVDGFYHFMVHMSVYGRAQCAICKNSDTVVSLCHTSLPDKCSQVASVSGVVKLAQNDKVWVSTWGPGRNDFFTSPDNESIVVGFRLGS
ncbi:Complement C1q and tumor necrosis factor-related protein 9 [Merluccius polli]|uniref:Complement C1q and tumor necrosis factor-related protein 9 n=1 Tax=Merluccius polli TaxID=89951 RepID=A0AA47NQN2_MERPO|nr:Complement C1q and tumor necrosis factor-related protein 9 [Merluccius polli]